MATQRRWPGSSWKKDILYLPYIQGLSESVERAVKDMKIRTVFKTTLTLRHCLTKVKTPADPKNSMWVWKSACGWEHKTKNQTIKTKNQIKQSKQRIKTKNQNKESKQRILEHKRAVKNADSNNGLAVHITKTKHQIEWDKAEVICREEQWMNWKIKESLMLKAHDNNINLDAGVSIDTNWIPPSY